jgi:hypothetical protein
MTVNMDSQSENLYSTTSIQKRLTQCISILWVHTVTCEVQNKENCIYKLNIQYLTEEKKTEFRLNMKLTMPVMRKRLRLLKSSWQPLVDNVIQTILLDSFKMFV